MTQHMVGDLIRATSKDQEAVEEIAKGTYGCTGNAIQTLRYHLKASAIPDRALSEIRSQVSKEK